MITILVSPLLVGRGSATGQTMHATLEAKGLPFLTPGATALASWKIPAGSWQLRGLHAAASDGTIADPTSFVDGQPRLRFGLLYDVPEAWERTQLTGILIDGHNQLALALPLRLASLMLQNLGDALPIIRADNSLSLELRLSTDNLGLEGTQPGGPYEHIHGKEK